MLYVTCNMYILRRFFLIMLLNYFSVSYSFIYSDTQMFKPLKLSSWKLERKFWQWVWNFMRSTSAGSERVYVAGTVGRYCTFCNKQRLVKFPLHSPSHTQGARWHRGICVPGGLFAASGHGCLSANTPSIADMKGCQKCDGWVASWGLATAATSGVRGEIGSERVKYGGPLWPDNYPDWIHLAERRRE